MRELGSFSFSEPIPTRRNTDRVSAWLLTHQAISVWPQSMVESLYLETMGHTMAKLLLGEPALSPVTSPRN